MSHDFSEDPHEPQTQSSSGRGVRPPTKSVGVDQLEFQEPVQPPRGLMRKRPHIALWILAALLLGAIIALALVGLSSG